MQRKTSVLLINLGTPKAPTKKAVRQYLREFLADPRVIDIPKVARWLLLNLIILPIRPRQSAKAYQKIWLEEGSPLLVYGKQLKKAVAEKLGDDYAVEFAMRYGQPSIEQAIKSLAKEHCEEIIVLPMFPQYSSASTGSAIEKTLSILQQQWNIARLTIYNDFHSHALFIKAFAKIIEDKITEEKLDYLLFSYHGLPERHIEKSQCDKEKHCDRKSACPKLSKQNQYCYRGQCYQTSRLIAQQLNLSEDKFQVSFQSRLGSTPWIKPYTDLLLPKLAEQGIKKLAIVCPSFVADCLETLEEIGIRAKDQWRALTGEELKLIPCLNDHPLWVEAIVSMVKEKGMNKL